MTNVYLVLYAVQRMLCTTLQAFVHWLELTRAAAAAATAAGAVSHSIGLHEQYNEAARGSLSFVNTVELCQHVG